MTFSKDDPQGIMMKEWYYAEGQQRQGPVAEDEIRHLFQRGQLTLDTLVWTEGMAQWAALRTQVDELQLQTLATATTEAGGGIDLRGDYAAIDNGTAPLPGASPLSSSPYTAPASSVGYVAAPLQGGDVVYAGFWKRVAAYLIDYVILFAVSMVVSLVTTVGTLASGSSSAEIAGQIIGGLIGFVIGLAYYGWFHASTGGATPGKMAIGIKVVRSTGERISLARSIGRYFATILSGLILAIGYIMAAFTERKQALHDMLCDTVVVDKWAFTDQPHLQRQELGTVTVIVLVIGGVGFLGLMAVLVAALGMIAKMAG